MVDGLWVVSRAIRRAIVAIDSLPRLATRVYSYIETENREEGSPRGGTTFLLHRRTACWVALSPASPARSRERPVDQERSTFRSHSRTLVTPRPLSPPAAKAGASPPLLPAPSPLPMPPSPPDVVLVERRTQWRSHPLVNPTTCDRGATFAAAQTRRRRAGRVGRTRLGGFGGVEISLSRCS